MSAAATDLSSGQIKLLKLTRRRLEKSESSVSQGRVVKRRATLEKLPARLGGFFLDWF